MGEACSAVALCLRERERERERERSWGVGGFFKIVYDTVLMGEAWLAVRLVDKVLEQSILISVINLLIHLHGLYQCNIKKRLC
jgi:hypothetical protein